MEVAVDSACGVAIIEAVSCTDPCTVYICPHNWHRYNNSTYHHHKVASQFNCLEFVGPGTTPEQGVTIYASDRTQVSGCHFISHRGGLQKLCYLIGSYEGYITAVSRISQSHSKKYLKLPSVNDEIVPTKRGHGAHGARVLWG